jgi:hypothetical protein
MVMVAVLVLLMVPLVVVVMVPLVVVVMVPLVVVVMVSLVVLVPLVVVVMVPLVVVVMVPLVMTVVLVVLAPLVATVAGLVAACDHQPCFPSAFQEPSLLICPTLVRLLGPARSRRVSPRALFAFVHILLRPLLVGFELGRLLFSALLSNAMKNSLMICDMAYWW